jgi:hypothetical protein
VADSALPAIATFAETTGRPFSSTTRPRTEPTSSAAFENAIGPTSTVERITGKSTTFRQVTQDDIFPPRFGKSPAFRFGGDAVNSNMYRVIGPRLMQL